MHFGDSQSARIVAFSSQARQRPKARTLPGACHYADADEVAAFFKLRSVMQCSANWGRQRSLWIWTWERKCSNLRLGSISRESESQIRESGQTWLAGWTPHWGAWEELLPLLSARVLVFPQITCMGWKHPIKAFQYSWWSSVCHWAVSPLPRSVWV